MYVGDFDNNKKDETIVAIEKNGKYYTINGLDELTGQLTYLKKKYTSYKKFAGQTVEDIFGKEKLSSVKQLTVNELASGYLKNEKGVFSFIPFKDASLQLAPITELLRYDFNADGFEDLLLAGNYFGVTPYQGKFDSFSGAIIKHDGDVISSVQLGVDFSQKAIKGLNIFNFNNHNYLLVTINNDEIEIYKIKI